MRVLITGATGFVGQSLAHALQSHGHDVVRATRQPQPNSVLVTSIDANTDWRNALRGCDAVVHLAARVHQMRDASEDPLADFRRVNTQGTIRLAQQAHTAGVRRFLFLSSIKVNGEEGVRPYRAVDPPHPQDAYGMSKWEAEQGLRQLAAQTNMETVIIRPPLVYGPGAKANFHNMMRWLHRGVPLPLASVTDNRRSLVALDNLVDLLITCLDHPAAANQTFLASDGEDLSTADLLRRLGRAMGHPARLFHVPTALLQTGARLLGKVHTAQRLLGSLQVDIDHTRRTLGWTPLISVDEGLRRAAQGFQP
jgi:nucleoside-diphosphate-sugar epimerase